jgi:hypothetical protein
MQWESKLLATVEKRKTGFGRREKEIVELSSAWSRRGLPTSQWRAGARVSLGDETGAPRGARPES